MSDIWDMENLNNVTAEKTEKVLPQENVDYSSQHNHHGEHHGHSGEHHGHSGEHHGHGHHSHHSGHHHGGHHSEHHSHSNSKHGGHHSNKKKTTKLGKFGKKHSKLLKVLTAVVAIVLFVSAAIIADRTFLYKTAESESQAGELPKLDENRLYVGLPVFEKKVQLVGDVAKQYLGSQTTVTISELTDEYEILSENRFDMPKPLKLSFDIYSLPKSATVKSGRVEISENERFVNSAFYDMDKAYTATVYNLKTGTEYYYRAHFKMSDGNVFTYGGVFETESGPRFMYIDGIFNSRDIGGWKTVDGREVKQGLIFRGTEADGAVAPKYKLTEKGVKQLVLDLGVKTDMDLRTPEDSLSGTYVLGANIKHKYYSLGAYEDAFSSPNKSRIREIFADLANPDNYPIYLHCTYGCDRTGTVCYILEAMLGLSEEDLIREYELSGLYNSTISRSNIMKVYGALSSYEGETIKEKTENFLLSCGVTSKEIESIRDILLERD